MSLMFEPFRKYATFSGRARRAEYWWFQLFLIVVESLIVVLGGGLSRPEGEPNVLFSVILALFVLGVFLPALAVTFRRLHDTNRSAWWLLLGLLPILGALVLLVFMVLDGTPGPNKYGPDPKTAEPDPAIAAA